MGAVRPLTGVWKNAEVQLGRQRETRTKGKIRGREGVYTY